MKELIDRSQNIVICTHVNPDGDAIGSSLAMRHYFERKGKEAIVIVPNIFPDFLKWLPGADDILVHTKQETQAKAAIEAMNGQEIGGRKVVVNEARPREERPRTFRPRGERR